LLFLNETRKLGRSHCLTVLSWWINIFWIILLFSF
jgi:hypothetical protein